MPRTHEQREATAERRATVVQMRREKKTFAEIGAELGVSMQRAHEIYLEALKSIVAKEVDQLRAEQIELSITAIDDLMEIARDHKQPRTAVEAWSSARGWARHLAQVTGSDATMKIEATVSAKPEEDPELTRLLAEARERLAHAEQQLQAESPAQP